MEKFGATPTVQYDGRPLTREAAEPLLTFEEIDYIHHTRYEFYFPLKAMRINGRDLPKFVNRDGNETAPRGFEVNYRGIEGLNAKALGIDFAIDPEANAATAESQVVEGRFPAAPDEVAVNHTFLERFWLTAKPGDTLELVIGERVHQYTVVGLYGGIVNSKPETTPLLLTIEGAEALRRDGTLDDYYFSKTDEANADAIKQAEYYLSGGEVWRDVNGKPVKLTPEEAKAEGEKLLASIEPLGVDNCTSYTTEVALKSHTLYSDFLAALDELNAATGGLYSARLTQPGADDLLAAYTDAQRLTALAIAGVLVLAATVILIMTALAMHERRYEIGVLLAVGMPKWRIAALFACENLIFTLLVTTLAYLVGLAVAPTVADRFLEGAVTVTRTAAALPVAARMAALAVGLSIPATAISSAAILRYRPMAILRSRA